MARKTIRVKVPISKPDEFSKLLKGIKDQHTLLGNASPFMNNAKVNMITFDSKRNSADQKRVLAENLRGQSEQAMQDAKTQY